MLVFALHESRRSVRRTRVEFENKGKKIILRISIVDTFKN